MGNYRLTKDADQDLANILRQGIVDFGLDPALTYYDGLQIQFQEIADAPFRYQAVDDIRPGYRRCVYVSHAIYYHMADDGIVVARVLRSQDPLRAMAD